jgi:hypothetical protein
MLLDAIARSQAQDPQAAHRELSVLLDVLASMLDGLAGVTASVERMRLASMRKSPLDGYRLVIVMGVNVPRLYVVSRASADPPAWVDVSSSDGVLCSLRRDGPNDYSVVLDGATEKLTQDVFRNALSVVASRFMASS